MFLETRRHSVSSKADDSVICLSSPLPDCGNTTFLSLVSGPRPNETREAKKSSRVPPETQSRKTIVS